MQPTSLGDLAIHIYIYMHSISLPSCALIQWSTGEDGDDEAAERWMEKARDRKLEWDAEAIVGSIAWILQMHVWNWLKFYEANVKTE